MGIYFLVQYFHICSELELLTAIREYAHEKEFSDLELRITYLLSYMEKPLRDLTLLSNKVSSLYLVAPGEHVRSLVKSDFFPYPIPIPFLFIGEGML